MADAAMDAGELIARAVVDWTRPGTSQVVREFADTGIRPKRGIDTPLENRRRERDGE